MKTILKKYYPIFPIIGLGLYLIFFTLAALNYQGGSRNLPSDSGYSFFHNFLCDVSTTSIDVNRINYVRSLGIIAHLLLSFTMISFFYILPEIFPKKNRNTRLVRIFGMLTMTVFILMFTSYHDQIVTITGILGSIALIPFFVELNKLPGSSLKSLAYVCYAISIVVFIIFQTKWGFYYLPFIQKIAFVVDAWWVVWVSIVVWRKKQFTLSAEVVNRS